MYSFPNFEPVHCSMSSSSYCFLIGIHVSQEAGKVVWYSHPLKNFPVCRDPHKGFSTVNEAEGDVFLEFPCFLYDSENVGNLISGSPAFSKPSLDIWKFLIHIILKPSMQHFRHDLSSLGGECNCLMVSTLFSTTLLEDWDED